MPEPSLSNNGTRRHDLDALRAIAMLLGIVLHGSMSFMPGLSVIRDTQQAAWVWIVFLTIHGFRMPLFFLVSGFFTAMLWRKRGLKKMLLQRSVRILLPCLLGAVTIVPLDSFVGRWAAGYGKRLAEEKQSNVTKESPRTLFEAIRNSDFKTTKDFLEKSGSRLDLSALDPEFKLPALHLASLLGRNKVVEILVHRGADIQQLDDGKRTALHAASFLGRVGVVKILLDHEIDVSVQGNADDTAMDSTYTDWETTQGIASWLKVPELNRKHIETGRKRIRELLLKAGAISQENIDDKKLPATTPNSTERKNQNSFFGKKALEIIRSGYTAWLTSDRFKTGFKRADKKGVVDHGIFENLKPRHLIFSRVFDHLWFLWFLCWLILIFVCTESLLQCMHISLWQLWPFQLNTSIWWMVPLTLLPQLLMGSMSPRMHFGPDTSLGILPQPHLVVYYSIFFGFGMSMFISNEKADDLGRWWPLHFLAATLCFPVAFATIANPVITAVPQILFAWLMCFGCIGIFKTWCSTESRTFRYISDSSYWLYLMHIPLVMVLACLIQTWRLPVFVKLCIICFGATFILLITYQLFVRHTWIGLMLHGSRKKESLKATTP